MTTAIERKEWISKRRNFLGASDVAAVLGVSPWAGPLDVYLNKVCNAEVPESRAMRRGTAMEPVIADWYAEETGREIQNPGTTAIQIHPDIPFLSATLDRLIVGDERGRAPLEIKSVGGWKSREEWEIDPPLHYQVQVQIQMAVIGASWGALCGGFAATDEIIHRDLDFDTGFFAAAVPVLEEFWRCVQKKTPPPAGENPRIESVKKAWSSVESGKTVALSNDTIGLVAQWEAAKNEKNAASKKADELEARIRDIMKDAEWGALPDGSFLSLKTTTRKGYSVGDSTFRTLRRTTKGQQK